MADSVLAIVASLVGGCGSDISGRNARAGTAATASGSTLEDLRRVRSESAPRLIDEVVIVVCRRNQLSDTVSMLVERGFGNGQRVLVLADNRGGRSRTLNSNRTASGESSNANRESGIKSRINLPHRASIRITRISGSVTAVVRENVCRGSDKDTTLRTSGRNRILARPITSVEHPPETVVVQPRINLIVQRRSRRTKVEERVSNRAVERRLSASNDVVGQLLVVGRAVC